MIHSTHIRKEKIDIPMCLAQRLSTLEKKSVTRVQNLDDAAYVSICTNALWKGIRQSVLLHHPGYENIVGQAGFLAFVRQLV